MEDQALRMFKNTKQDIGFNKVFGSMVNLPIHREVLGEDCINPNL